MGLASHIGEWHAPNPHRCVRWIRAREGGCARAPLWPGGNGGPLLSLPHSLRPPARSRAASPARSRARSRRGMGWGEGGEKDARALQTETARGRKLKGEQRFPENGCGERREWGLTVFFFLQRGARTPHTPHTSPHVPATMALGRAAKAAIVLLGELKGPEAPRRSERGARALLPPSLSLLPRPPGPGRAPPGRLPPPPLARHGPCLGARAVGEPGKGRLDPPGWGGEADGAVLCLPARSTEGKGGSARDPGARAPRPPVLLPPSAVPGSAD